MKDGLIRWSLSLGAGAAALIGVAGLSYHFLSAPRGEIAAYGSRAPISEEYLRSVDVTYTSFDSDKVTDFIINDVWFAGASHEALFDGCDNEPASACTVSTHIVDGLERRGTSVPAIASDKAVTIGVYDSKFMDMLRKASTVTTVIDGVVYPVFPDGDRMAISKIEDVTTSLRAEPWQVALAVVPWPADYALAAGVGGLVAVLMSLLIRDREYEWDVVSLEEFDAVDWELVDVGRH